MKKTFTKKLFLVALLILGCFVLFGAALALETAWPESPMHTKVEKDTNIGEFIKYLYEWGIALGGVATFIAFVIAGFQYITSVGNPQTMKDAIDRIKSAMFGLVMLLSAYVLLNTINPELTEFKLDPFNPTVADDYFQACDPTHKCPEGYRCATVGGSGICMVDSGDSTICSKAVVWSDTNFKGTERKISVNETIEGTDNVPKSIRAKFTDKTEKDAAKQEKYCDQKDIPDPEDETKRIVVGDSTGCGCVLRLFAENKGWLWSACGDVIRDVPAYEADLTRWADRNVYCVQLIAPEPDKSY